jgi:hypothetical protein
MNKPSYAYRLQTMQLDTRPWAFALLPLDLPGTLTWRPLNPSSPLLQDTLKQDRFLTKFICFS